MGESFVEERFPVLHIGYIHLDAGGLVVGLDVSPNLQTENDMPKDTIYKCVVYVMQTHVGE